MNLNQIVLNSLSLVNDSSLIKEENSVELLSNGKKIVKLTKTELIVGDVSFQEKIQTNQNFEANNKFEDFIKELGGAFLRLNHLGISYFVSDFDLEIARLNRIADSSGFKLYEEKSGNNFQKWLFLGQTVNWQDPLFELVLNRDKQYDKDIWRPHFQIDIDTSLTIEELRKLTDKTLGKGFIKWELNFPKYGSVLAMGILDNLNGVKIALGIGTNLRKTEWHREKGLKVL